MIITGALKVVFEIFETLLGPIFSIIPDLPDSALQAIKVIIDNFTNGVSFLIFLLGFDTVRFLGTLLSLVLDIELFIRSWNLIGFVIEKIPFLDIEL